MSHEITLERATECAHQIEIIARMMESYPCGMEDCEVEALASLIARLSGSVVVWLGEEQAQREGK